jgi:HK97 family phage prohead protease
MSKRRRRPITIANTAQLVTFAGAAAPAVEADAPAREVAGLVVPFGPPGSTSDGLLSFRPGSLTWSSDVSRIKLLRAHDQNVPLGHATELRETPAGLWGRFSVAEGPEGDQYLAEVADRRRDGLSVGVFLDSGTRQRLRRAQPGQVVAGSGVVRETSGVSVPAFDDARAQLGRPAELAAANTGGLTRFDTSGDPPAPEPGQPDPGQVVPTPVPTEPGQPTQPAPPAEPGQPTTAGAGPTITRAAAGAAVVTGQPSTYGFGLSGRTGMAEPSLVRDAFLASFGGYDERADAHRRLDRFNAELRDGNPATVGALLTAAGDLTTAAPVASPAERADFPLQGWLPQNTARGDLMLRAVDAGRPIASRLQRVPITNAQPFLVPIEGEFEGVGLHTEGTPHVAAGTLELSDSPVIPRAMSGAYVVSRELVDGSNPAIDAIAMRAMLRDYRRESEGVVVTALLASVTATDDPLAENVDTAIEMRTALALFVDDDDQPADFVFASRAMIEALYAEVDGDGRPMIAGPGSTAPSVAGTSRAGYTGIGIDGTELVRASRLTTVGALAVRRDGVLFLESNVQQFRFDEILGPGQIKLALWAYVGAAVLRPSDIGAIYTGAGPA